LPYKRLKSAHLNHLLQAQGFITTDSQALSKPTKLRWPILDFNQLKFVPCVYRFLIPLSGNDLHQVEKPENQQDGSHINVETQDIHFELIHIHKT